MNSKTNAPNPICPKCNTNTKINKAGHRKTASGIKQRYFCKECQYKFVEVSQIVLTSYPNDIILYALQLSKQTTYTYKKEIKLSLKEISHLINKKFSVNVNHSIISYWINNYKTNKFLTSVIENDKPIHKIPERPDPDRIFKPFKIVSTSIMKEDID